MLEMIAIIAVVLAIAVAAVLILAATRPDTFRVQRTASIKAPPERIFPLINDNMDRMVGRDFEAGLASLKALAER